MIGPGIGLGFYAGEFVPLPGESGSYNPSMHPGCVVHRRGWLREPPRWSVPWIARVLLLAWIATAWPARAENAAPVVLVVGDSISAGHGLARGAGWVDLLVTRLARDGYRERVVNASISGDTTAGGRARLPALLREHRPAIVVVELGGNDALRGGNLDATRANLDAMVKEALAAHAKVLILGMKVPPNYGSAYARRFESVFNDVAKANKVALVPYVFEGFGDDLAQFQEDRIHPKAAAEPRILDNVWPALVPLLSRR
jgi:acyl-CoA thioesterase-1